MSHHISVEKNRRRQMTQRLSFLRSLIPRSHIKRGDQASIISGVIEFIKELQQMAQSLEEKRRSRKMSGTLITPPAADGDQIVGLMNNLEELGTSSVCCNSPVADVEAKILGSNVIVRTICWTRTPGQIVRIISILEKLCFQIVEMNVNTMEDCRMLYSFLLKIGGECQVSMEEVAFQVQQSFLFHYHA